MPFFAPLPPEPEPELESGPSFFSVPGQRPQHWVPGAGPSGAVLARSDSTMVFLGLTGSYPQGIALDVRVLVHPEHTDVDHLPGRRHRPGPLSGLRLGMQWADGRRVEAEQMHGRGGDLPSDDFHLDMAGGGGGGLEWRWNAWLWPLPPAEPVDFYVEWSARGIPETRTTFDLAPAVGWAEQAFELWPLPGLPEDAGWFSYRPI
jgi:hypothetical protein